ncbi:hypothetical protein FAGAP_3656 [Fusarium agapanthi]|uniref:2EXR domain-containing protein n=1 Tax=Fusarium agapanthi TaxID=1803897 RepID=A0A9P5BF44_9HYPO|nr:hypothetical protein FAGAP_3656 [Fusarium agapanthi]
MARFDDLPPELRAAIWEYTLPEDENAIYVANLEWAYEFFPTTSPRDLGRDGSFKSCLPARIQVPIPGVYNVCRDARPRCSSLDGQEQPPVRYTLVWRVPHCDELGPEEHQNLRNNIVNLAVSADSMSRSDNAEEIARLMLRAPSLRKIYVIFNGLPHVKKISTRLPNGDEWWSDMPVQQQCEIASQPKPHELVHSHRLDRYNQLRQLEKVYLRDPQKQMDGIWRILVDGFPDIAHSVTKELKVPRVDVTIMQVPTWDIVR